ncbi:hypothetical protein D6783_00935 [Candidatus Woesearchaeota archaeon]|nr:MAG: hypothetical protein D6783_00935 [Candidatus Woesearchaeota archaeon]
MHISTTLSYYKRDDVREALVHHAQDREVGVRFGDGFGKRPDALFYPADVLALAVKRATSFHCSEERWRNPLQIRTGMSKRELDALRIGWDFVVDIDAKSWELAKLSAFLIMEALALEGVSSLSCKFSGNKGFHVGVPFEAFPQNVQRVPTSSLFPEAPRRVTAFLLDVVSARLTREEGSDVVFAGKLRYSKVELSRLMGAPIESFVVERCASCLDKLMRRGEQWDYVCPSCGGSVRLRQKSDRVVCETCNEVMARFAAPRSPCSCGKGDAIKTVDVDALLQVDALVVSSRHLFRMPYSLHEKSGLVSLPIDPKEVLVFERDRARPEAVETTRVFLDKDRAVRGEAADLLARAFDFAAARSQLEEESGSRVARRFDLPEDAIGEEFFPPCIAALLAGVQDGRKRALFALTNFLRGAGWSLEEVEERLRVWNGKNAEPLREVLLKGHLRYHQRREVVPPPSCRSFYEDLGVCKPDALCARVKNPLAYAKKKAGSFSSGSRKRRGRSSQLGSAESVSGPKNKEAERR